MHELGAATVLFSLQEVEEQVMQIVTLPGAQMCPQQESRTVFGVRKSVL